MGTRDHPTPDVLPHQAVLRKYIKQVLNSVFIVKIVHRTVQPDIGQYQ